ncbi:hypothetical protein BDB01DRAFT_785761 [Pilobolus umbonatus]|nr:hypothetical protein BDB01DRAFT_785761 [Pilobolus umbonatus]
MILYDLNFLLFCKDLLSPIISPASTPSVNYQAQYQKNDRSLDFSPLSSPAIQPQSEKLHYQQQYQQKLALINYQEQLAMLDAKIENDLTFNNLTSRQIKDQYEKLENMKRRINEKLTVLQKSQQIQQISNNMVVNNHTFSGDSNVSSSAENYQTEPMHYDTDNKSSPASQFSQPEPVTPSSLMNMKMNNCFQDDSSKTESSINQVDYSSSDGYISSTGYYDSTTPKIQSINTSPSSVIQDMTFTSPAYSKCEIHGSPKSIKNISSPTHCKQTNKQAHQGKKQRRESQVIDPKINHTSPRTLKPLLISPTLRPGTQPLPLSLISALNETHLHSVEDAERILASKSNYQNLLEGKGDALGISFSTEIKSGLEIRRTAHKAAEQKRRDSLKTWFDRLRNEVEDGYVKNQKGIMSQIIKAQQIEHHIKKRNIDHSSSNTDEEMDDLSTEPGAMKPLSKVLLLQYAYEYIHFLKSSLEEKDTIIHDLSHTSLLGKRKNDSNEDRSYLE